MLETLPGHPDTRFANVLELQLLQAVKLTAHSQLIDSRFATDLELRLLRAVEVGMHDGLTGLYNRAYWEESMKRLARCSHPFAILFIDVNRLKALNDDDQDHTLGDNAIKATAQVIANAIRGSDVAARYGGDEFAILLTDISIGEVQLVIDRINTAIAGRSVDLPDGVSIGWSHSSKISTCDPPEILRLADRSMYENKMAQRTS